GGSCMGYFVAYVIEGQERPQDGDSVASGTGWLDWADWASGLADRYPEAAHLAEEGGLEPAEALDALEHGLEELRHEKGGPKGAAAVTGNLLAAVKHRPAGCAGLIVTDGTEGDTEEE